MLKTRVTQNNYNYLGVKTNINNTLCITFYAYNSQFDFTNYYTRGMKCSGDGMVNEECEGQSPSWICNFI